MNLIVDAGNTRVKLALFQNGSLMLLKETSVQYFQEEVSSLFKKYTKINRAIVSNVGLLTQKHLAVVSLYCSVHILSHSTKVPFKNSYASPETLGVDRLALMSAAFFENTHKNTLVIDAGTCVTYDIINDFDEYLGGAISPGLQMRYIAMHEHTAGLPPLEKKELLDFIGNTTENCMHSGVLNGLCNEMDGTIDQYRQRFKDLTVILTGGDSHFLSKRLKNTIFADSNFLLKGLNYLLEYNKH
jgi:type III pantothenate kinase